MGINDPGDWDGVYDPTIGVIEGFLGWDNFQLQGKDEVGPITNGGGEHIGDEKREHANVFSVDINVDSRSRHIDDLHDLSVDETKGTLTIAIAESLDKYAAGEPGAFIIENAKVKPGGISGGSGPSQGVTFTVTGHVPDPKNAVKTVGEIRD